MAYELLQEHQVAKKSAVANLFFEGSQSVWSGRQSKQITPTKKERL